MEWMSPPDVIAMCQCQCRKEGMTQVSDTACAKRKPESERRICSNGLPEIPGLGGIDLKIQRNDEPKCNPAVQKCAKTVGYAMR